MKFFIFFILYELSCNNKKAYFIIINFNSGVAIFLFGWKVENFFWSILIREQGNVKIDKYYYYYFFFTFVILYLKTIIKFN